jgi:hypothetical protein
LLRVVIVFVWTQILPSAVLQIFRALEGKRKAIISALSNFYLAVSASSTTFHKIYGQLATQCACALEQTNAESQMHVAREDLLPDEFNGKTRESDKIS